MNNLAMAQLRLGSLDEAETNAAPALRVYPNSKEVQNTLQHIQKLKSGK